MPRHNPCPRLLTSSLIALGLATSSATVSAQNLPSTADRPDHQEAARDNSPKLLEFPDNPLLPEGMTLQETLDAASQPVPGDWPDAVFDDDPTFFVLIDQLEYRDQEEGRDQLGWEAQGWIGYDYDKFWWKSEGESVFDGTDEGESENDLLYSRLITPFWNAQVGVQYANEWESGEYDDRWSGVIALQGLAPGMFELDNSLYISEDGDVTASMEAEYDLRITQRLVLQPRAELAFAAQDVPERNLGAGMTGADFDLRLRYEVKREFAPYIGVRYSFLTGETADMAEAAGSDSEQLFFLAGVRLAF